MNENLRLKEFRKAEKMTQVQFVDFINSHLPPDHGKLTQGNLVNMEKGQRPIPNDYVRILHDQKMLNYDWWYNSEGSRLLKTKDRIQQSTEISEIKRSYELMESKLASLEHEVKKLHAELRRMAEKFDGKQISSKK